MKCKKYSSSEEAIKDLEQLGELKYFGREGTEANGYVYQYKTEGRTYTLVLYEDGNVVVLDKNLPYERGEK